MTSSSRTWLEGPKSATFVAPRGEHDSLENERERVVHRAAEGERRKDVAALFARLGRVVHLLVLEPLLEHLAKLLVVRLPRARERRCEKENPK